MPFSSIFYVLGICVLEIDGNGQSKENCHNTGSVGKKLIILVNRPGVGGTHS